MDNWLSLNEYSNKYQVSLSTLRRRIKSDRVEFAFRYGKYFLKDVSLEGRTSISSPHTPEPSALRPKGTEGFTGQTAPAQQEAVLAQSDLSDYSFFNVDEGGPAVSMPSQVEVASEMTSHVESQRDLNLFREKTDYELIIQKQKTQIIQLQAELVDLKTLVMALEK